MVNKRAFAFTFLERAWLITCTVYAGEHFSKAFFSKILTSKLACETIHFENQRGKPILSNFVESQYFELHIMAFVFLNLQNTLSLQSFSLPFRNKSLCSALHQIHFHKSQRRKFRVVWGAGST